MEMDEHGWGCSVRPLAESVEPEAQRYASDDRQGRNISCGEGHAINKLHDKVAAKRTDVGIVAAVKFFSAVEP
jgi:hypothetical protein